MNFQKLPQPASKAIVEDLHAKAKSLALCSSNEARSQLPYEDALTLKVLPLGFTGLSSKRILQIAVAQKVSLERAAQLKFALNSDVRCIEIEHQVLDKAIQIAYRADDAYLVNGLSLLAEIPESKTEIQLEDSNAAVPQALKTLLEYAVAKEASDIHLVPTSEGMTVKLRVNGDLLNHQGAICSSEVGARLISRIKILASLRIDERSLPQDGSFTLNLKNGARQLRVSLLPTIHGEKCVLRLTSEAKAKSLNSLGLSRATERAIQEVLDECSGLILLTGTTGSGKTTTLYAITQALKAKNLSIASVEDPVESHIEGISQTSLAPEKGLDYPNALRSILRQDPDVILIGEIRDIESANLVLSAALSGHLVLSTVHGSCVSESITRLTQMGLDCSALNQVLRLIISQSLVKQLCTKCKIPDLFTSQDKGFKVFKAVGCPSCDYSGFDGRLLVVERMRFTPEVSLEQFRMLSLAELENLPGYESSKEYLENYERNGLV